MVVIERAQVLAGDDLVAFGIFSAAVIGDSLDFIQALSNLARCDFEFVAAKLSLSRERDRLGLGLGAPACRQLEMECGFHGAGYIVSQRNSHDVLAAPIGGDKLP